jgi:hypothetical protein
MPKMKKQSILRGAYGNSKQACEKAVFLCNGNVQVMASAVCHNLSSNRDLIQCKLTFLSLLVAWLEKQICAVGADDNRRCHLLR